MDSDTKSFLMNIASIVIAGAIIYYLFYKPAVQLQQQRFSQLESQLRLQPYRQVGQQDYQQYQQTQPLPLSIGIVK